MRRQGHRARQPTHAIGRPSASEQTFRLRQSTAPQQTRRGRHTASAQLHSQCRRSPATFRWTGSAAPQPSTGTPPPPSAAPYENFDDIEDESPQHGSYSYGFLATAIDSKMATLRGTTNSFFLSTSSQVFKLAGDIALLIVAVAWLGMDCTRNSRLTMTQPAKAMLSKTWRRPKRMKRPKRRTPKTRDFHQDNPATFKGTLLRLPSGQGSQGQARPQRF